jgi:hypothetical protein
MGGAVAALRREQCAAAEEEAAAAAEAATAAAAEEATKEAVETAAALVARISVLDDQSDRLTTHLPARALRGRSAQEIDISHPEWPEGINLDREQPEIGITHPEQPGLGQAWLFALGDFNLDPAQVLDEVRAVKLLPVYFIQLSPAYFIQPSPAHFT